jgi:hypothetical protein
MNLIKITIPVSGPVRGWNANTDDMSPGRKVFAVRLVAMRYCGLVEIRFRAGVTFLPDAL